MCGNNAEGFGEGAREGWTLRVPLGVAAPGVVVVRPRCSTAPSVSATAMPGICREGCVGGCVGSWSSFSVGGGGSTMVFSVRGVSWGVGGSMATSGWPMAMSCLSGSVDAVCWVLAIPSGGTVPRIDVSCRSLVEKKH